MTRAIAGLVAVLSVLLGIAAPVRADDALGAYVASAAKTFLQDQGLPGVSVGIMREGKPVLVAGFGLARLDGNRPARGATLYDIGSVTKQFVAAAVVMLARDGKLSLDDPVSKYVPRAASGSTVRIRNLLNQTAGYVDYYPMDFVTPAMQRPTTADAIIATYAAQPLEFVPGSRYSYSNTNYVLLGKIVDVASGEPWETFLARRIFTPLGMGSTFCDYPQRFADARHAYGYTSFALGPLTRAVPEGAGWAGAAGCLASDASDLLTWDAALAGGRLFDAATFAQMSAPTPLSGGKISDYGFGLSSGVTRGHRYVVHDGGVSGFSSFNILFPDDKAALVVLVNADNVEFGAFAGQILRRVLFAPAPASPSPVPVASPAPASSAPLDAAQRDAIAVIRTTIAAFQRGDPPRSAFTSDFNAFLTPQLVQQAAATLSALGPPASITATVSENHGTEFVLGNVAFAAKRVTVVMRRLPDKKIAQFLIQREQ